MTEHIKYHDREFFLMSYNVKIEKELIWLCSEFQETIIEKIEEFCERALSLLSKYLINKNNSKLYLDEKIFILLRLRAISVNDEIKTSYSCSCSKKVNLSMNLNNLIKIKEIPKNLKVKNIFRKDPEEYFDPKKVLEMDLDKFMRKSEKIQENLTEFSFTKEVKCPYCKAQNILKLDDPRFFLSILMSSDIMEFYKSIASMVYNGRFTLNDVLENMLPFEKDIYIACINQINEQSK